MRMLIMLIFAIMGTVLLFNDFSNGLLCYIIAILLDIADTLLIARRL